MRTIRFGKTEARVPAVSLGTWGHGGPNVAHGSPVGWSGHDDQAARQALVRAHELGITHWDTADAYGGGQAETLIGSAFADVPRRDIFLATKVGWVSGPHDHYYEPAWMRQQMERSLANMKIEVIDLYYLHHCDFGPGDRYFDGALETVRRFRDEGKIRFIGLSDWDASKIARFIDRVDPDVVQPYRNVVDDDYESSGLRARVDALDCGVAFFSPLRHGLLLGKYDRPQNFPEGDFRSGIDAFRDAAVIDRMKQARAAVMLRFPTQKEPVLHALVGALLTGNESGTVLLGQRTPQQVEAASRIGDALSEADAAWVRSIYRGAADTNGGVGP
jgi:aryl-alcohol dehydrogenase-like predicted oxidoreductase